MIRSILAPVCLVAGLATGCGPASPPADPTAPTDDPQATGSGDGSTLSSLVFGSPAREVTVPAGTALQVRLTRSLSSDSSAVGDRFSANVVAPVRIGEDVVIDEGATMTGRVVEVVRSKKIGGRARLAIAFDQLRLDSGAEVPVDASISHIAKSQTKKDAATIGGATAGGALLGRIIGHDRGNEADGTAIGAVVGAAVGTAIAASNQGEAVVLPEGAVLEVRLDAPVDVEIG